MLKQEHQRHRFSRFLDSSSESDDEEGQAEPVHQDESPPQATSSRALRPVLVDLAANNEEDGHLEQDQVEEVGEEESTDEEDEGVRSKSPSPSKKKKVLKKKKSPKKIPIINSDTSDSESEDHGTYSQSSAATSGSGRSPIKPRNGCNGSSPMKSGRNQESPIKKKRNLVDENEAPVAAAVPAGVVNCVNENGNEAENVELMIEDEQNEVIRIRNEIFEEGDGENDFNDEDGLLNLIPQGVEEAQPSSDSDTEDEAHHPRNDLHQNHNEDVTDHDSDSDYYCSRAIDPTEVPLAENPNVELALHLEIISATEFSVRTYRRDVVWVRAQYKQEVINGFRNMDCYFDTVEQRFVFPIKMSVYEKVLRILGINEDEGEEEYPYGNNEYNEGFTHVIRALSKYRRLNTRPEEISLAYLNRLKEGSQELLTAYQKESIKFGLSRGGRVMIADEHGMGKTVVGIGLALYYEKEWPLLVLCMKNQQEHWETELRKWLPDDKKILSLQDEASYQEFISGGSEPDVVVLAYSLLCTLKKNRHHLGLKEKCFRTIILDASNKLKYGWTLITQAARGLIKRARRRILLTSNPVSGVPVELFRQVAYIDREAFGRNGGNEFAGRYCGRQDHMRLGVHENEAAAAAVVPLVSNHWRDARNLEELRKLLFGTVLIRHFRSEFFQLPVNLRYKVNLPFEPDGKTKSFLEDIIGGEDDDDFDNDGEFGSYRRPGIDIFNRSQPAPDSTDKYIFKWYKASAWAKIPGVWQYLRGFDFKKKKTIIYCRHVCMRRAVRQLLTNLDIKFIRIRPARNQEEIDKEQRCQLFNTDPQIRVAVVSLEMSTVGVDLHAADTIIFTELYWVPDSIHRNESRACAPLFSSLAQKPWIDIKYLVIEEEPGTTATGRDHYLHIDKHLWEMLLGKMDILDSLGLIQDENNFLTAHFHHHEELTLDPDWDEPSEFWRELKEFWRNELFETVKPRNRDYDYRHETDDEEEEHEDEDEDDLSEVPSDELEPSSGSSDDDDDENGGGGGGERAAQGHESGTSETPSAAVNSSQESQEQNGNGSPNQEEAAGPSYRLRDRSRQQQQQHGQDEGNSRPLAEQTTLRIDNGGDEDETVAVEVEQESDSESPESDHYDRDRNRKSILLGSQDSLEEIFPEYDDSPGSLVDFVTGGEEDEEDNDSEYRPPGARKKGSKRKKNNRKNESSSDSDDDEESESEGPSRGKKKKRTDDTSQETPSENDEDDDEDEDEVIEEQNARKITKRFFK